MSTVTVFKASRMQAIEDAAITGAYLSGDDLVLVPNVDSEINVGSVRGPQGDVGPTGADGAPVGTVTMFAGLVEPSGYFFCNGQEKNRTTEAALFAVIGTQFGAGNGSTTFNLPDFGSRFPVGVGSAGWSDALSEIGGSADAVVVDHDHDMGHQHPDATTDQHSHGHDWPINTEDSGGGTNNVNTGVSGQLNVEDKIDTNTDHHTHDVPAEAYVGNTANSGESGVEKNLPPYLAVNFIVKA